MSRAEEMRAKAARMRERRQTGPASAAPAAIADADIDHGEPAAVPAPAPVTPRPAVRVRPVRKTVDLPPQRYAALTQWCSETAGQLGVARVTGQDVLAALVARLLTDETLARRIRADLADDIAQR